MRYTMKRNWISGNGREPQAAFVVRDDKGRSAFVVDAGEFHKPNRGNKVSFQDLNGCELAYVRRRMAAPGCKPLPAHEVVYEIYHGNDLHTVVERAGVATSMRCAFVGDGPAPDDLTASGNFFDHEYHFSREGRPVARVSRSLFPSGEAYGVDVGRGEDDVVILVSSAVIDLCCLPLPAVLSAPQRAHERARERPLARRAG